MQLLLSRAGLALNPGQVADLVLAWRQVAGLIAGMPHARPLADDIAFSFRLMPPASIPGATRSGASAPTKKGNTQKGAKKAKAPPRRARLAVKSKAKAKAKRRVAPAAGRKSGKRRR
jgi:hypothetical protein